jgi:hypothetical protein
MLEYIANFYNQSIQWFQQYNWLVTLLISIPLSILANIFTDPFKQWLAGRSQEQSKKRVQELERDLRYLEELENDRERLSIENTKVLLRILIDIGLGGAMSSFVFIIGILPYLMAVVEAYSHMRLLNRISDFNNYKSYLEQRIARLKLKRP